MRLLSPRLLVVLAAVVVAWGGVHLLSSHSASVTPAVWPVAEPRPTPSPAAVLPLATPSPRSDASSSGAVPILPGVMQQLNGSTRDTAIGLYAVIQQLEAALRSRLEALSRQLQPGR